LPYSLDRVAQKQIVAEYFAATKHLLDKELALESIYFQSSIKDKVAASIDLRADLANLTSRQQELAPLAESILQEQISNTLAELGLTTLGQPLPSVLYHSTPLPFALIVSPENGLNR